MKTRFLLALGFWALALWVVRAADIPALEGAGPHLGWIPMQHAAPGETLEIDMRRFFYPGTENPASLHVASDKEGRWEAHYDNKTFLLTVILGKNTKSLVEIPLRAEGTKSALEALLLVAVEQPAGHTFRFHPQGTPPTKVTVAGAFNGWNTQSHELRRMADGSFELFVPLSPGRQPYKFVLDGQWTLDPSNAEKVSDGGSENSVVTVKDSADGARPVVVAESVENGSALFRVVGAVPSAVSSILQLPDGTSRTVPHEISGERISIRTADAPDGAWVRVAVADSKGRIGNVARTPVRPLTGFQWQDGIIYYAFTDRFADGEKSNDHPVKDKRVLWPANYQGGDFQGIQKKIQEGYFEHLGVNVLWLAPINRNPEGAWQESAEPRRFYTGYHGYWPVSHSEVEPRFGGEEGLKQMIATAHKVGIRIMADLVLRHVHVDDPLWKERPELFGTLELPDGTKNLRRWDDHQFTTWFEEWLPGFNFNNPEAVAFLLNHAVDFANRFGFDGYRLDAVKHIERGFWWDFRAAIRHGVDRKRAQPLYSVGETFMDRRGIMSFVGPGMLDGQFDFPLYDTLVDVFAKGKSDFGELEKSLSASESVYGKETPMSPLVGNHDKARFMAYADGDLPDSTEPDEEEAGWKHPPRVDHPAAYEKLKMAFTFILSIDGVPMVYYGDEIGMSGAGDPDNRRMMRWEKDVTSAEESVREHFRKVAAARHQHPALRLGSRRPLVAEHDRYAFVRAYLGDAALVAWNRGKSEATFELEVGPEMADGNYIDAVGGGKMTVKNGKTSFGLGAMKSAIFAAEKAR